ncbi:MAG: cysteine methyltransferase, partial [Alkalimonas sp.]|nr:cysteine methyltransferase [Alkalimonas sp.]
MTECIIQGPCGPVSIQATPAGISAVRLLPGDTALKEPTTALLTAAAKQLEGYFTGTLQAFNLPLVPAGTAFQQQVWQALLQIPFG